jgi:CheY-like chemotaxis protein
VLVIEDDAGIRELLTDLLQGDGYAVTATDSALGAATLVRRLLPRVILLDLGLPYRSGGALLHDLKADPATAGIPILVVSALAETLTPERRALTAGVVAKPFSPDTLLGAVRSACGAAN